MTISNPELRKLLEDPEIAALAKTLSEIRPGWYSGPQLAWRVGGTDSDNRTRVYALLDALADAGKLHGLSVCHNNRPLKAYEIQFDTLPMLLRSEGIE